MFLGQDLSVHGVRSCVNVNTKVMNTVLCGRSMIVFVLYFFDDSKNEPTAKITSLVELKRRNVGMSSWLISVSFQKLMDLGCLYTGWLF